MISLLVPSRGRPESCAQMIGSANETADDFQVIVRIDSDDPKLEGYKNLVDNNVDLMVSPRGVLSGLWNECALMATGEILMQCADDIRFRSPGWDTLVHAAFDEYDDKIAYVYGRDGIADERMATHGFMHRTWYETLGYFTWPHFTSDYGDLWNHTIAERLDRLHFLPDVYTEHLHPAAGKGVMDQTHIDRMERDLDDDNAGRWETAQPDLEAAVSVLAERLRPQPPTETSP